MPPRKSNFSRRCQARPRNTPGPARTKVNFHLKISNLTWLMQAVEETTPSLTVGTEPGGGKGGEAGYHQTRADLIALE